MGKRGIVHIEIPSNDLERSGKFYSDLFGWKITPMPDMNYATWDPEEGPGGGFNPIDENTRIGEVLIYVASDDIDADLKRAESLGGTVVRTRTEIPSIGSWGAFKDPAGNVLGLYTSMNPRG